MKKIKHGTLKPDQKMPTKGIDIIPSSIFARKHKEKQNKPFQGKKHKKQD